ncbi:MAG: hypothetical protein A2Y24_00510 [Clostridiales bacterium GWE2_32_10]|nr:MAG: hypothetical protein A2Y24_00510 [Clostridiales bacterium GWE2_32_10]
MRGYQSGYVHGSVAYKLNQDREVEQKKSRIKVKKINRELLSYRFSIIVSSLVVFGMFAGVMTQYSSVSYKQNQIKKIEQKIKLVQDDLYDAKVAIAESMDTENVTKVATEKLGMVKAADYQIVYINIPEESYTVKY